MHRLAIRTRLALTFVLLAGAVLGAAMLTIYLVERHEVHLRLVSEGRQAATQLAALAPARDESDGGDAGDQGGGGEQEQRVRRFLQGRAGGDDLLLLVGPGGVRYANAPAAEGLSRYAGPGAAGGRVVHVAGRGYLVVAVPAAGTATALAAVPTRRAEQEIRDLLRSLLFVGGAALLATLVVAWLAAARALVPLRRVARRAADVSAGDLSVRIGGSGSDEIGRVSAALDDMLDRLQSSFAAQERLVQDASHELRTPITIARGQLEVALLTCPDVDPEVARAIRLAIAELDRMARLVDGMLRLAEAAVAGHSRRERVALRELAESAVARSRQLGERGFRLDTEPGTDLEVVADPDALEQVLLNLLSNAVRHTRVGGSIVVSLRRDGRYAIVDVADDGEGIGADVLPHVFDRFARAGSARSRDTGGAGLGLAICREIVDAHAGRLTASNGPGGGATFTLRLPLAAGDGRARGQDGRSEHPDAAAGHHDAHGRRVGRQSPR